MKHPALPPPPVRAAYETLALAALAVAILAVASCGFGILLALSEAARGVAAPNENPIVSGVFTSLVVTPVVAIFLRSDIGEMIRLRTGLRPHDAIAVIRLARRRKP